MVEQGWDGDEAKVVFDAYYRTWRFRCRDLPRFSRCGRILHELDVRLSAVLAVQTQPKAALDDCFSLGAGSLSCMDANKQKKLYAESFA